MKSGLPQSVWLFPRSKPDRGRVPPAASSEHYSGA